MRLWDVATRRPWTTLGRGGGGVVRHITFAGNDRTLAADSSANSIALWDVTRQHRIGSTLDVGDPVEAMALSRDGHTLASATGQSVRLWDVASHRPLGDSLHGDDASIAAVAFAPDGALVSADRAGTVVRWDPLLTSERADAWRQRVCRMVGRDLTEGEWGESLPDTPYQPVCGQHQSSTR